MDPVHGEDLILSIDSELQYISENLCSDALQATQAFKCSVVFMNAENGEIIISAEKSNTNNKYFNINLISGRALYEPGSALKIFTVGSLLEKNEVNENDTYYVEDKIEIIEESCNKNYEGLKGCFRDFLKHDPYVLTVKEIIERSSNVGTIKITQTSNVSEIENFLIKFGFGEKTGVELTGETRGGFIDNNEKSNIAKQMSKYTGISSKVILQHNLDLPTQYFWKELLREKTGQTIGRLDSRTIMSVLPNVGMNIAACLQSASSIEEVAAVPGKITPVEGELRTHGKPQFGTSKHLAEMLLEAKSIDASKCAIINIRPPGDYEGTDIDAVQEACNQLGWSLADADRNCLEHSESEDDNILDNGDYGL